MKAWLRFLAGCVALAALSVSITCQTTSGHHDEFTMEGLVTAQAADLSATVVSAHLDVPIEEGHNVLWCGTFQLAWNELCDLAGGPVRFADPNVLADKLNRRSFTKAALDKASYVALAGHYEGGILGRINSALENTFGGRASPRFRPKWKDYGPTDIVAYSYLFKNLEFENKFERLSHPLDFCGAKVASFGIGPKYKSGHQRLYSQVMILDYKSPDDFAVELVSKPKEDRVILAKVASRATLSDTANAVLARGVETATPATYGDILVVPKFNFDVTQQYEELKRRPIGLGTIQHAVQDIRFQMDEEGVRLRSEGHSGIACSARQLPTPTHVMVFDKPFLIMLKRADAKRPYFAMWVDNAELLVNAK